MVTTRAGSRAASESLGSPAPKRVASAKSTPKSTPKSKGTPKSTPLKKSTKSPKSTSNTPSKPPHAKSTGKSARRRAQQKSRIAALRGVKALEISEVEPELRETLTRTLRQMLDKLGKEETMCASRVPRLLAQGGEEEYKDWQKLLPAMAAVVAEEGRIGKVELIVNGQVVESAEGPVRVRRGKKF